MVIFHEQIIIAKRKIAEIYYRQGDKSVGKLILELKKGYPQLEKFFSFKIPRILIRLKYSRKQMDRLFGRKTPDWLSGGARVNKIYILSPEVCRTQSCHQPSDMLRTLVHEIVHIFIYKINKNAAPWLNEGVALNLAGQKKRMITKSHWNYFVRKNFIVNTKMNWWQAAEHNGYGVAYWFVRFLLKKYGPEKILELLTISPKNVKIAEAFKRALGISHHELEKKFEKEMHL